MTAAHHYGRLRNWPSLVGVVVLILAMSETGLPQDVAAWTTDLDVAQRAARKDGSVVLVIETGSDFTAAPFTTPASRVFELTGLRNPRVVEMSERRLTIVGYGVDAPAVFRKTDDRPVDGAILYFCDAELRVLDLLVGYPSADRLVETAESAERLNVELAAFASDEGKRKALRDWHESRTLEASRLAFRKVAPPSHASSSGADAIQQPIQRVVKAANAVRQREIAARFSANWPGTQLPTLAARLALHGDVRTDFAHLVLAGSPLVSLTELHDVCYETIYERPHWHRSSRAASLHRWFVSRSLLNRPMLFVLVSRDTVTTLKGVSVNEAEWRSESAELDKALTGIDVLALTHAEAATLAHDTALQLPGTDSEKLFRYLLIDGNDRVVGTFGESTERRLTRTINSLKAAKPGTKGFASASGKGKANEPE